MVGLQGRPSEHAICGSSRDDQDGAGSGPLTAVRQGTVYLQVFTGTLRAECGGSAAITVCGNNASHLDHIICHFIRGKACGIGSLLAINHRNHQRTVCLDTNKGSGSNACTMILATVLGILINGISICIRLHQESKGYRNCLLFPAGKRICHTTYPDLRNICGSVLFGKRMLVIVDDDNCLCAIGSVFCKRLGLFVKLPTTIYIKLTVKDRVTERLTNQMRIILVILMSIPTQRRIGSNNHVTVAELFCIERLRRGGFSTVVTFFGPHPLIAGNNLSIGIVEIHRSCVDNLSASTRIVVQNKFGLCNPGS